MKKSTKAYFLFGAVAVLSNMAADAQTVSVRRAEPAGNQPVIAEQMRPVSTEFTARGTNKAAALSCVDKINYVGNNQPGSFVIGGLHGFDGLYQVFPGYTGNVIGVEFVAEKYPGTNPTVTVQIMNPNSSGYPGNTIAGPPAVVTITNTSPTTYTVMFSSPAAINGSNGFSVAFFNWTSSADSLLLYRGNTVTTSVDYSYITVPNTSTYTSVQDYFGWNVNFLLRPIVTTGVNPNWVSAKTSTGCGVPAVFSFTNTSNPAPAYAFNPVITPNASGYQQMVDFGDGTPTASLSTSTPLSHSYTTVGAFTASFTQTYIGWTNNCAQTITTLITVEDPKPSFVYDAPGLTVTFTNTSQNITNLSWNFGDLSTSTQNNPSHTYATPGTYVVELTGMAPCGPVKYSVSISVSPTGIRENAQLKRLVSLYPNPAANSLVISSLSQDQLGSRIEIFSTVGASVKTIQAGSAWSTANIDISDLQNGLYFVKLQTKGGDVVKSFIKE